MCDMKVRGRLLGVFNTGGGVRKSGGEERGGNGKGQPKLSMYDNAIKEPATRA